MTFPGPRGWRGRDRTQKVNAPPLCASNTGSGDLHLTDQETEGWGA